MGLIWRIIKALFTPAAWDLWEFAAFATPWLVTGAAAVSGIMTGVPTMWIITGAALAFGGSAAGMFWWSKWLERSRVRWKLRFVDVTFSWDSRIENNKRLFTRIQYGLQLENVAHYPIRFQISRFESSFATRRHDGKGPSPSGIILPHRPPSLAGENVFPEPPVELSQRTKREGVITFEIKYGRWILNQRIRHTLKTFVYVPDDLTQTQFTWSYADEIGHEPPSD